MHGYISFVCQDCGSRLRASARFIGRSCPCPRCGQEVVVPPRTPAEEAPMLVLDDGHRRLHGAGSETYALAASKSGR